MRYLAPATDVHDEVDLVTIPSVGKADRRPESPPTRESRSSRKARSGTVARRWEVKGSALARRQVCKLRQKYRFSGRRVAENRRGLR